MEDSRMAVKACTDRYVSRTSQQLARTLVSFSSGFTFTMGPEKQLAFKSVIFDVAITEEHITDSFFSLLASTLEAYRKFLLMKMSTAVHYSRLFACLLLHDFGCNLDAQTPINVSYNIAGINPAIVAAITS